MASTREDQKDIHRAKPTPKPPSLDRDPSILNRVVAFLLGRTRQHLNHGDRDRARYNANMANLLLNGEPPRR